MTVLGPVIYSVCDEAAQKGVSDVLTHFLVYDVVTFITYSLSPITYYPGYPSPIAYCLLPIARLFVILV